MINTEHMAHRECNSVLLATNTIINKINTNTGWPPAWNLWTWKTRNFCRWWPVYCWSSMWNDPWQRSLLHWLFVAITYGNVNLWLWKSLGKTRWIFLLPCGHSVTALTAPVLLGQLLQSVHCLGMSVLREYAVAAYFSKVCISHIFSHINWHYRRKF